ncbi:MAG: type II toxin-antitoxin system VapC family toxin [Thiomonas arsenitoxydans]|uniref:Ribonuclease VapC n=1 Tax=Thiomonas arsenitoxydans (strain DSM 22701 / CIP 110005 / 3As) TaxID=426114 RepID=A0A8I1SSS0_THIA3|nr:type II toxin-antitoxin system VapC family toxin [Thiomonas arsenitoxydans]
MVDSSAWLEYFADGPSAEHFAPIIEKPEALLVPTITLFEVFKRVAVQRDENDAIACVAVMQQGEVVPIDAARALQAAKLSLKHRLPTADSLIYATAQQAGAELWTQNADFEGLPGVRHFSKARI